MRPFHGLLILEVYLIFCQHVKRQYAIVRFGSHRPGCLKTVGPKPAQLRQLGKFHAHRTLLDQRNTRLQCLHFIN
jgi:hypothetical protein